MTVPIPKPAIILSTALLLGTLALSCTSSSSKEPTRPAATARLSTEPASPSPEAAKASVSAQVSASAKEPVAVCKPGPVKTSKRMRLRGKASLEGKVQFTLGKSEPLALLRCEGEPQELGGERGVWAKVETIDFRRGWVFSAGLDPLAGTKAQRIKDRSRFAPLDSETLPKLLKARGLKGGKHLKILVIEIVPDGAGGFTYYPYDNGGTAFHRENWWPASSIKIFAAVAALQVVRGLGMSPNAIATFQYQKRPRSMSVQRIVELAITPSNNQAFDRLVEIVGFDRINRRFFIPRNGFRQTVFLRSYTRRIINPETELGTPRHSPAIEFKENKKSANFPERNGSGEYECPYQGNCTTPWELAETMRRVMMHEHLPPGERFALEGPDLHVLRKALADKRPRGTSVVEALRDAFGNDSVKTYHKPGYAYKWFSDNVFLYRPRTNQRWIVVIANHPGRGACDEAAGHVGALLARGKQLKNQ